MRLAFEILNFLLLLGILVWLFKRFKLGSLLERRQQAILANIEEAKRLEREAEELRMEREKELSEAKRRAREISESARISGERLRKQRRTQAEAEARRIAEQARAEAEAERTRIWRELHQEVIDDATLKASRIIKEELNEEDHVRMVRDLLARLDEKQLRVRARVGR